jgi:phage shock protein A
MRELEGQTVQLIGEKKSLENNLEEARLQLQQLQLQQMSAVPQAVPEVEIDQVKLYFLRNLI